MEALLAVAIVVVLAGALFATLHAVRRAAGTSDARQAGPAAGLEALRRMSADLAAAYDSAGEAPAMELRQGPESTRTGGPPFLLRFSASLRPPDAADPREFEIVNLLYECRIVAPGETNLVRIARTPAGAAPDAAPATGTLLRAAAACEARVWDGTNWVASWAGTGETRLPQAARVILWLPHGDGTWSGEVVTAVAAGNVIRPPQTNRPVRSADDAP